MNRKRRDYPVGAGRIGAEEGLESGGAAGMLELGSGATEVLELGSGTDELPTGVEEVATEDGATAEELEPAPPVLDGVTTEAFELRLVPATCVLPRTVVVGYDFPSTAWDSICHRASSRSKTASAMRSPPSAVR